MIRKIISADIRRDLAISADDPRSHIRPMVLYQIDPGIRVDKLTEERQWETIEVPEPLCQDQHLKP